MSTERVVPLELSGSSTDNLTQSQERLRGMVESCLGTIRFTEAVSGGLVHYIYRVTGERQTGFVKIRAPHYASLPSISADPSHIRYERKAISLLAQLEPEVFPHLLGFDQEKSMILMTDVIPSGKTLEDMLNEKNASERDIEALGQVLARTHVALSTIDESIREDGDEGYYNKNLLYRLGYLGSPVLDETVSRLSAMPRQLILGDVSPKNIGINNDVKVTVCDLESVHRGNTVFDLGFAVAHILIHNLDSYGTAKVLVEAFLEGYRVQNPDVDIDSNLLKQITLGISLYRLTNPIIPYALNLTSEQRQTRAEVALGLLEDDILTWERLIQDMTYVN